MHMSPEIKRVKSILNSKLIKEVTSASSEIVFSLIFIRAYKDAIFITDNAKRLAIYKALQKHPLEATSLSIMDISKLIDLSYQNTLKHIKDLENLEFIETVKQLTVRGRSVYVKHKFNHLDDFLKSRIVYHASHLENLQEFFLAQAGVKF